MLFTNASTLEELDYWLAEERTSVWTKSQEGVDCESIGLPCVSSGEVSHGELWHICFEESGPNEDDRITDSHGIRPVVTLSATPEELIDSGETKNGCKVYNIPTGE